MSSRHLLDPKFQSLADASPPDLCGERLSERRALAAHWAREAQHAAALDDREVSVQTRHVSGPPGAPPVRVVIYTPPAQDAATVTTRKLPALVHLHGGGMVMGQPENAHGRNLRLAAEVRCVVVSVDYRLAPETPLPGAVEDAYAVLRWVHDHAQALGVDRTRLAVAGESAGGGIAAALALLARERGEIALRFQLLNYPMLDDRTGSTGPVSPYAGEFVWTPASNRFGWRAALAGEPGGPDVSAYSAPARAQSLADLPAAFIALGALDLFAAENLAYAGRLLDAGVPTELHVYPGAPHGFDSVEDAQASQDCWLATVSALSRALHA
jgi:triacylglycerol lipase